MQNQPLLSDIIHFKANDKLFVAAGKDVRGITTYSIGNYKDVEMLKLIKAQFNENSDNAKYIKNVIVPKLYSEFKSSNIDVIVYPSSSSGLLAYFSKEVSKQLRVNSLIKDSFVKGLPSEITIDSNGITLDIKTIKSLHNIIETAETNGYFELKKVPVQFRSFFTGYVKLSHSTNNFVDKNVLVIDDVLTSGATLSEIYKILSTNGAKSIIGITLLKKKV